MSPSIKIASINIERSKHLDNVAAFIERVQPDILCVQEVTERDISKVVKMFGASDTVFAPMLRHAEELGNPISGIAVFSRVSIVWDNVLYYFGTKDSIPDHHETLDRGKTMNCALVVCDIENSGARFRIGTTHFTWSDKGEADDLQRKNVQSLLKVALPLGEIVFCGDFNAPRGGEIFGAIAEKYRDNIPAHYTTSIDKDLHRAGDLQLMVDGLFSTPGYKISDVELHSGVSDHMAITAIISV